MGHVVGAPTINNLIECIKNNRRSSLCDETITFQLKIQLGVYLDKNSQRIGVAKESHTFSRNVPASLFFATFHALGAYANFCSATETTLHSKYTAFPLLHRIGTRWEHHVIKTVEEQCLPHRWFDVRIVASEVTHVEEPEQLRAMRAQAQRCSNPMMYAQSRAAFPCKSRMITSRWLQFTCASSWRVVFSIIDVSGIVLQDTGMEMMQYTMASQRNYVHEIHLVCVADATTLASAVVEEAQWLLDYMATVYGQTLADISARLQSDRLAFERQLTND